MKTINIYLDERLGDIFKDSFKYHPKSKEELIDIIKKRIDNEGNYCDLNDISVIDITDMSRLFSNLNRQYDFSNFDGDISKWDVSNVTRMDYMFYGSSFSGDIHKWDVSNVTNMKDMFYWASQFKSDISNWNVKNVTNMDKMFKKCSKFKNVDLSKWNVKNVKSHDEMFVHCELPKNLQPKFE